MELEAASTDARSTVSDSAPDDEVVARCRDGDVDEFRVIVERYGDYVFRTIYLMTRDRQLAEDLTQETFVSAWRGLRGFRLGSPFRPWLMRIAVNGLQSHRRRRLLPFIPLPLAGGSARSRDPSPETRAEDAATGEELRRALAELRDEQRHALVLRYYAELSVPEIARATGWRDGTVKSRLHRALARMRLKIERMDEV